MSGITMQPSDLFELIMSEDYHTAGDDVDYSLRYDDEENTVRLIFQGSTSIRDWINDFRFPAKIYKEQDNFFLVHRGFGDAWKSAKDVIMADLLFFVEMVDHGRSYNQPLPKIQIIGHSMGGALALLAAEDYRYRTGRPVDEVITFGSPKPIFGCFSKRHFKKAANSFQQFRFSYDGVTWLPPFLGYYNITSNLVDRKNWWKLWRVINTPHWHVNYGDSSLYY